MREILAQYHQLGLDERRVLDRVARAIYGTEEERPFPFVLARLDDEEKRVLGRVVARVLAGREVYGELRLVLDKRAFGDELRAELADAAFYAGAALERGDLAGALLRRIALLALDTERVGEAVRR